MAEQTTDGVDSELRKAPPARIGKKSIGGHFDPTVSRQLKQIVLDENTTVQALLLEALNDLFVKHGGGTEGEDLTEDEIAFGKGAWVYCTQHMRPHQTGWCSVSPSDKVGLGVTNAKNAVAKCRSWRFLLYSDVKTDAS
jgi:hypothetical protein